MKIKKEPLFIDMVQEALADPKHRMMFMRPWNHIKKSGGMAALVSQRLNLEKSQVFKLSDDFVRLTCDASNLEPGTLLNTFSCARPPYEKVWMEWDEEVRLLSLGGVIGQDSALRIGAFVDRYPGADDEFVLTMYWQHRPTHPQFRLVNSDVQHPKVFISTLSVRWSVSPGGFQHFKDLHEKKLHQYSMKMEEKNRLIHDYLLSRTYMGQWGGYGKGKAALDRIYLNKIEERLGICFGPGWRFNVGDMDSLLISLLDEKDNDGNQMAGKLAGFMSSAIASLEGDIRFIVTALALMQTKWTVRHDHRDSHGEPRQVAGTKLKWLEAHECVITAPKERVLRGYPMFVGTGGKRREHGVMGHYCYRQGTGLSDCVHHYEDNEKGQEVCKNCRSTRWWRNSHRRGSLDVGKVDKTYRVEAPS